MDALMAPITLPAWQLVAALVAVGLLSYAFGAATGVVRLATRLRWLWLWRR